MICLPNNKDISGLGVDTSDTATPSPRAEILPGMNAAIKQLQNKPKPMNLFEKVAAKVKQSWGKQNVRYGTYGVAGLAAILVGCKLLKK